MMIVHGNHDHYTSYVTVQNRCPFDIDREAIGYVTPAYFNEHSFHMLPHVIPISGPCEVSIQCNPACRHDIYLTYRPDRNNPLKKY